MANIENYLPLRIRQIEEIADLCKAENPEFDEMRELTKRWIKNKNPLEAYEEGLKEWEKILDIKPANDSLEIRRFRIVAKLNEKLPYTYPQLLRMLNAICGIDGYKIEIKDFILMLTLASGQEDKLAGVVDMLRDVVPMHIFLYIIQKVEEILGITITTYSVKNMHLKILPYQDREAFFESELSIFSCSVFNLKCIIKPRFEIEPFIVKAQSVSRWNVRTIIRPR